MEKEIENSFDPELKKIFDLKKEELEKIFSQFSPMEIKNLLDKLQEVQNND